MRTPRPTEPGPGQESVWDYPRPPRLDPTGERIRVVFAGTTIADSRAGLRVLETSHPPVYYFPPDDVAWGYLVPAAGVSICEFKGAARYWTLEVGDARAERAAWSYPTPAPPYVSIRDCVAFYASRVDSCWVGGEQVRAQPGDFYGGWVTSRVVGPFKGGPGTLGW